MRLRTALFTGLATVVVLVGVGVVVVTRIDANGYYKNTIIDKVTQATGRKLVLGGELRLTFLPAPALTVKDVSFANPDWAAGPQMMTVGELSAQVALWPLIFGGDLHIDRLVLKDVDLRLATDAKGRGNWQFGSVPPASPPPTSPPTEPGKSDLPSFDKVMLENIAIHYTDGQTGQTMAVVLSKLLLSGAATGPMEASVSATYQGLPIEAKATLGALSSLVTPGRAYPVNADVTAAGATLKLIGSVAEPFTGRGLDVNLALEGRSLTPIGALLGVSAPEKPYHVTATLVGDADGLVMVKAVQATLGTSSLSGGGSFSLNGARPKVSATLALSPIDLSDLPKTATKSGRDDRVFSKDPLPLSALRGVDADLTLTAETMKTSSVLLQKLSLHLLLDDRNLLIKPVAFDLDGGHVVGSLNLSTRQAPAVLGIDLDGRHLDLGKLLLQLSGTDLLTGQGDLTIVAHGSGDSVRTIMATLDGSTSLMMGHGVIKSRYVDLIGADVFREAFAWTQGKQDSKLTCMVSRFDIQHGLATSRDLLIDTSDVTILGTGTANLGTEQLDLELVPRPKETSLLNLAMPLDITGSFSAPILRPNRVAVAKNVAQDVATWINPLFALVPLVLDKDGDKNPCATALETRKTGSQPASKAAAKPESGGIGGAVKSLGRSIGDVFK